jgi:hypothetical protein
VVVHRPSSFCHWQMCWPQAGKPLDQRTPRVRLSATSCSRVNRPASVGAARFDRGPGVPSRPEVTNGPFLSHKRRERQRRRAGVAEFRRERRLSLRTALTGNRCLPTVPTEALRRLWVGSRPLNRVPSVL